MTIGDYDDSRTRASTVAHPTGRHPSTDRRTERSVGHNRPVSRCGDQRLVDYAHSASCRQDTTAKPTEKPLGVRNRTAHGAASVGAHHRRALPIVDLQRHRGGEFSREPDAPITPFPRLDVAVDALAPVDIDTLDPDIAQLCCEVHVPTQFPTRMWDCEGSRSHDVAATLLSMAGLVGYARNRSLDGVVRLSYPDQSTWVTRERATLIRNGGDYISDHDGLNVDVALRVDRRVARGDAGVSHPIEFNVITQNLEGLCSKSRRYDSILAKLGAWFRPHVRRGTLLVVQELVLQLKAGDAVQTATLDRHLATVLAALQSTNPDLQLEGETDGYTGCVIYDSVVWERRRVVVIRRDGSSKCSNAYLMQHREEPACCIWLVNIHLKAVEFYASQEYVNEIHADELTQILLSVLQHNNMKYPVYLCGDFNNPDSKHALVRGVLTRLQGVAKAMVLGD